MVLLIIQHQSLVKEREEAETLRRQVAQLATENERPAAQASTVQSLSQEQSLELLRLRGEVGMLRRQLSERAKTQAMNAEAPPQEGSATNQEIEQFRQALIHKTNFAKEWLQAFREYAEHNQGQFPTNFDQAAPYLSDRGKAETNATTDQFEIVYQGSLNDLTNDEIIVLRERQPEQKYDGKWGGVYGRADGGVAQRFLESRYSLEQWENARLWKPNGP